MIIPAFLSGLVRAVIIMTLTGGLLALLLLVIKPIVRSRLPKTAQYFFWLAALASFLIPVSQINTPTPAANIPTPIHSVVERNVISVFEDTARFYAEIERINAYNAAVSEREVANNREPNTIMTVTPAPPTLSVRAITVFMFVYPWAALLVLLYSLIGYARFVRKLRWSHAESPDFAVDILRELTAGHRTPRLIVSDYAATPMLIGVFRPAIILPDREYTNEQMRSILLHELTHMRRFDVTVKWLSLFACVVHWFNPLVWIARREIDRACELSCDAAVIRNMDAYGKQIYGETLISVASDRKIPLPVLSTTMCEEKRALKERLGAIMKNKNYTKLTISISAVIFLAVVLIACATGASTSEQNIATYPEQSAETDAIDTDQHEADTTSDALPTNDDELVIPEYITIYGLGGGISRQISTELTELDLGAFTATCEDIVPLRYMVNLTSLQLGGNRISDLTPLAELTNLTHLSLSGNEISDLTPLTELTNLTELNLVNNQISDLMPLAGLTNLTELDLRWNEISDIAPLAGLTSLTHLVLWRNNISDIAPLAGLANLTELNLEENEISDIAPIAGLTNLTVLNLAANEIIDVAPIAGLTNLEILVLGVNPISDITPLAGLTSLTILNLMDNDISDISPLAGLTRLTHLMLLNNKITDITPLAELPELTELFLAGNPIEDWSPVDHIEFDWIREDPMGRSSHGR
ncbi:MAG: leucine-rich repeat domain-containing protein [Oscillospiraceae bacterium]|nr:leucine-rich repeat domain-containing protein [Oscillospiraceae bacterium]